jgi:hypothetical protein
LSNLERSRKPSKLGLRELSHQQKNWGSGGDIIIKKRKETPEKKTQKKKREERLSDDRGVNPSVC